MSLDDFEQRLRRETLRPVPPTWRSEILSAVRNDAPSPCRTQTARRVGLGPALLDWLWPRPSAWASLATCWVAIIALNTAAAPNALERARAEAGAAAAVAYLALLQGPETESVSPNPEASPADNPLPGATGGNRGDYRTPDPTRLV